MDPKTAAGILNQAESPVIKQERAYRTHPDKLSPYWPEVEELLKHDPKLKAYALFEEMMRRHPQGFDSSWKRTFERRVRDWKIQQRIEKDVTFDQVHQPGDVLAIDFTSMNDLGITIAHQKFDHMVFHAVLTYSNWEFVDLCISESFEALAKGIQGAFQAMGGVTQRIRNDSLSAAVNNLSTDRHFTANFKQLLDHFSVESHRINVRTPRENGDCESLHGHFKDYVDQRLRLRGSRDFESKDQWLAFMRECITARNRERQTAFLAEQEVLAELPNKLFPVFTELECRVSSNSIILVKQNRYSIPSCFIDSRVQVRIFADHVEVWHAAKKELTMPRLIGKNQEYIDFRHVIDSLVRKPNAFVHYRFREHMFPTLDFRRVFDAMTTTIGEESAIRVYLRMLQVAKNEGMASVDPFIAKVLIGSAEMSKKPLLAMLDAIQMSVQATVVDDVQVEVPDLKPYDDLLEHKEVLNEQPTDLCHTVDERATAPVATGFPFETTSSTNDAFDGNELVGTSSKRGLDTPTVPRRTDSSGMPVEECKSGSARLEEVGTGAKQNMGPGPMETPTIGHPPTHGPTSQRRVPQGSDEPSAFWETRFREDIASQCAWGFSSTSWAYSVHGSVCEVGTIPACSEEGAAVATDVVEAWEVLGVDHRRSWLCSAESRGNGSTLYIDRGSIREVEHLAEQQPTFLEVGEHLQRPDDDSRCHRSSGASQHHLRTEREKLSTGRGKQPTSLNSTRCFIVKREEFQSGILTVAKVEF